MTRPPHGGVDHDGRHVSGATIHALLLTLRGRGGDEAVRRALELAGRDPGDAARLADPSAWISYWEAQALLEAGARVLGGSDVLRTAGRYYAREEDTSGVSALMRALGSPTEVFRIVSAAAPRYCTVVDMDVVDLGGRHAVVEARNLDEFPRYRELCDLMAGILSIGPMLFGFDVADVVERECQVRGDARCLYHVHWGIADEIDDPARRVRYLEDELAALTRQFESLRSTVGDLVSGDDLDVVLARVVEHVRDAVTAPGYLLAVRPRDDAPVRAYADGIDERDVQDLAHRLLAGDLDHASAVTVGIASSRHAYGRLAALYTRGVEAIPEEREILASYARLAASALDSATALDDARREARTAEVMLGLAESLAAVTTSAEMAQRLADAVPHVVDCECAAVLLWDGRAQVMRVAGLHGMEGYEELLRGIEIGRRDTPLIARMLQHPEPLLLARGTGDRYVTAMFDAVGVTAGWFVPVLHGEEIYGTVAAGTKGPSEHLAADRHLVARLRGLAGQAATALHNARLVDQIRHQALHDALTGVANTRLLADEAEQAIATARADDRQVSLLFIDLDGFKAVNDDLGHAAGDALLQAVARRLRRCVRGTDTVARLGGDEFIVLLHDADRDRAEGAVARVRRSLHQPFRLAYGTVTVRASVGCATFPGDGSTYEALRHAADASMYAVKLAQRVRRAA
ncbi:MAG TPA: diguanylate cyclase [Acidimicrobiia bacterium]|nr:diguanylate cyclase [Acidimicrobiia bacterium]